MSRFETAIFGILACCTLTMGLGCGSQPSPAPVQAENDAVSASLAKLDPADRAAAQTQAICPVSDEVLGKMGMPVKVFYDGQEVFLCCEGCREDFEKDPKAMLAKLKK